MTNQTLEKAKELFKKIDNIQQIIRHLKHRRTGHFCKIYMETGYANISNSSTIDNPKILDKMCDLLINEYTQEL